MHLFTMCSVDSSNVPCVEDLDLSHLLQDCRLRLSLVDHNVPCDSQRNLASAVMEVIDHHDDTSGNLYGPDVDINVVSVGSCATLIADNFLNQKLVGLEKNPDLVKLLLGVILLDTENLIALAGLATDKDREVADALCRLLPDVNPDVLYRQLRMAAYENACTLLKSDYKDAPNTKSDVRAGGSTIQVRWETLFGQKYAKEAVQEYATEMDVDVFLVDCISYSDSEKKQRCRQLVIYSENPQILNQVVEFLKSQFTLGLRELPSNDSRLLAFQQGNGSVSRKKVLMMISIALMPTFKIFVDERASVSVAKASYAKVLIKNISYLLFCLLLLC